MSVEKSVIWLSTSALAVTSRKLKNYIFFLVEDDLLDYKLYFLNRLATKKCKIYLFRHINLLTKRPVLSWSGEAILITITNL